VAILSLLLNPEKRQQGLQGQQGKNLSGDTSMPSISMFYGLIVYLYFQDNRQHHVPLIHVRYQDDEVIV
jgi:hypothetical protein